MGVVEKYGMLVARILLATIFLGSFFGKITNFSDTAAYMAQVGMPAVTFMLIIAIVFEGVGGLSILLGYKAKMGAWILIVVTLIATYYFHLNFSDPMQPVHVMKNLTIIGGLLTIVVNGAGNASIDKGWEK